MDEGTLNGLTILVAEDEYFIATDLERELERAGARVLGPVSSMVSLLDLIEEGDHVDVAILDVNLQGEKVFPAAALLQQKSVPLVFTTGYDQSIIPAEFADVVRCEKPASTDDLHRVVASIVKSSP